MLMAPSITSGTLRAVQVLGTLAVLSLQRSFLHNSARCGIIQVDATQLHEDRSFFQNEGSIRAGIVTSPGPRVGRDDEISPPRSSRRGRKPQKKSAVRLQHRRNPSRRQAAWVTSAALATVLSSIWIISSIIRGRFLPAGGSQPASLAVASESLRLAGTTFFSQHKGKIVSAVVNIAVLLLILYSLLPTSTPGPSDVLAKTAAPTPVTDTLPDSTEGELPSPPPTSSSAITESAPFSTFTDQQDSHLGATESEELLPADEQGAASDLLEDLDVVSEEDLATTAAPGQIQDMTNLQIGLHTLLWLFPGLTGGVLLGRRVVRTPSAHEGEPATARRRFRFLNWLYGRDPQVNSEDTGAGARRRQAQGLHQGAAVGVGGQDAESDSKSAPMQGQTSGGELSQWASDDTGSEGSDAIDLEEMIRTLEEMQGTSTGRNLLSELKRYRSEGKQSIRGALKDIIPSKYLQALKARGQATLLRSHQLFGSGILKATKRPKKSSSLPQVYYP